MAEIYDILRDSEGDILIQHGDFAIGYSDEQHVEDIVASAQGSWKAYPLLGVHITKKTMMPTSETQLVALKKKIKVQLEYDNYRVSNIAMSNQNELTIDCERIS